MSDTPVHIPGGNWVGRSLRRVEDPTLVSGKGRFTGDLPAEKWMKVVRSPYAAGKIISITGPEGCTLLTAKDVTEIKPILAVLNAFNYAKIAQPILAKDEVRFQGEPVAVIIADSEAEAEDIASLVDVEIEPYEAIVTAKQALMPGSRAIHEEAPENVIIEGRKKSAGFDEAMKDAYKIIKFDMRSGRQNATPMEPRGAHGAYDHTTGRLTLTLPTQMPHVMRSAIANFVGIPEADLRIVAPDVGGGFGQKMSLSPEYALIAWLSYTRKMTIAWREDRRENLIASYHSREQNVHIEGGFDKDGYLLALSCDIVVNVGAYSCFPTTCGVEPLMAMHEMPMFYVVPQYSAHTRGVITNTCLIAPYRGVSRPTMVFCLERLMDLAGKELGIDPFEIRRRNVITKFPHVAVTGMVYDEGTYLESIDLAEQVIDVPAFRKKQQEGWKNGRYLGLGVASFAERSGFGTPAFAERGMAMTMGWESSDVAMDPGGFVEVRISTGPSGQGHRTAHIQIVADELGVPPEKIKVVHGDTDRAPYGYGTFGSRSTVISGGATLKAAQKVREKLLSLASILLEAAPDEIDLKDGYARVRNSNRAVTIDQIARDAYHNTPKFGAGMEPGIMGHSAYDPLGTFSNACHVVTVEVDIETGATKIDRYVVIEDAGKLINPMIVDGQIHGGVAQGVANALLEEILYDDTGNIITATLAEYLVPTSHEMPHIEIHHFETLTDRTILQAKGMGEGAIIGGPAAILNAIADALTPFNIELNEFPATPRMVRAAIRATGH
ncbi:xanthine dehydrogenase family protein molybdopterin-binding subunit [Mesorhizobium sp. SP-1A]|uniref:xanthine dehydrogenase family protein molybdopterin-binding subunit n=1 Tax=Mesorhizobium sp. SP-1A TaxID=3077840 RepID=UPI0028F6CE76|nr:xanthine dehydrogenase family protein molybdopterin-binding subunit [Mesorhizobium sp. SP-1A]